MKKSLLFGAAAVLAMGATAQVAELVDVTPAGYDFSQYADGEALHSLNGSGWSMPAAYDATEMATNGYCMSITRCGTDPIAGDENAFRIRDFGGHLGKCLVFSSSQWAPMVSNVVSGYGNLPSVASGGGNSSYVIAFHADPDKIQHGYSGAAVRVRIVYNVIRRARHANQFDPLNEATIQGTYAASNNYFSPYKEGDDGTAQVGYGAQNFAIYENEGETVAELPAIPTVKSGEGVEDPWDTAGTVNNAYTNQIKRFNVLEFDTYSPIDEEKPGDLAICLKVLNSHTSVVIKEIKFFNITNAMDLIDADENPIPGASLMGDRKVSFRYYTEEGVKEFEGGDVPPTPAVGTQDNPYLITTAAEFCQIGTLAAAKNNVPVYFSLENDIDMTGVDYAPAISEAPFTGTIMFNGNNHVVSNINITGGTSYNSIFGVLKGEVKNVGFTNVTVNSGEVGGGILGGYAGHSSWNGVTTIDNVYVIGTVESATGYTGGLFGTTGAEVKITNSYARVDVKNTAGMAAILGGRINNPVTVENVYVSGKVEATGAAAALLANTTKSVAPTVKNAVVLAADITGETADALYNGDKTNFTNTTVSYGTKVNGNLLTDVVPFDDCLAIIQGWDAFDNTNLENGQPVLAWQEAGVEGIEIDGNDNNAAAVYYNLQGQRVENPAEGLYIVKRGNKATKEIIR